MATRDFGGILNTTKWIDTNDETKGILLDLTPVDTGTTRTYTVVNSDTTLVGTDVAQTLTNKTINSTTNDIAANKIFVSGGNTVSFDLSPSPIIGQIIKATSATTAEWSSVNTNVFGSEYHLVNVDPVISTNSTTYILITSINTGVIPVGTYRLNVTFDWLFDTQIQGRSLDIEIRRDGNSIFQNNLNMVRNKWINYTTFLLDVVVTSSSYTYELYFKVNDSGNTGSIKLIKLELLRII